jgi:NADH dehydrogenase
MPEEHRVVIVGGGFGGLNVARGLRRAPVQLTLLDRRNSHLFQPLLYQVATGGLSPANIAAPPRAIPRRQQNACVLLEEAMDFRPQQRCLVTIDGEIPRDTLLIVTGARYGHFGHGEWAKFAPGL